MIESNSRSGGGAGFVASLTPILILVAVVAALKLTDVIDWSWFWVLSPILIPLAGVAALLGGLRLALFVLERPR